jgi:hypothetical protein
MKRTKERFGKLEMYNTHGISGCKVFDGEDLEYQDRYRLQQLQQKSWIEQQKYEHHLKQQEENEEQRKYAEQTLAINRMRSMLEAEHEERRRDMNVMQMEYNKKLAQMKRDKEAKEKYDETEMDLNNIRDAENTRNIVYARLKEEIDSAKAAI